MMSEEQHGMDESSLDWENDPEYRKEQMENLHDTPTLNVTETADNNDVPTNQTENPDADILLNGEDEEIDSNEAEIEDEEPKITEPETVNKGGDVLDDQSALFDQDDEADSQDLKNIYEEESDKPEAQPTEEQTYDEESDIENKKKNILYKIPIIRSIRQGFNDIRRFFNTFYDPKYWKNPYSLHGDYVRSRMMRRGWVILHRIEWNNRYNCYFDKMIFVKRSELTCQDTEYMSAQGNKQIPTLSGDWLIYKIKLVPAEFEYEGGFTQTSAYLYMLDTSTERAVNDTAIDLDKGNKKFDKSFIMLIGGAFIIIFGFFLLGGFK